MNRPAVLALITAAALALLGVGGWLWWRYGMAVFLGGGVAMC